MLLLLINKVKEGERNSRQRRAAPQAVSPLDLSPAAHLYHSDTNPRWVLEINIWVIALSSERCRN